MRHLFRSSTIVASLALFSLAGLGQTTNPPPQTSESSSARTSDLRSFIPNTLDDQKQVFGRFPSQVVHGKHLLPIALIVGATAGLVAADQYDASYFRKNTSNGAFNSAFSSTSTAVGIVLAPAAFYSVGLLKDDDYTKQTGMLAAEAAVDGIIADFAVKLISDRRRPTDVPHPGNYADSFYEGNNYINGSFPSGHAATSFSIATVVSRRYGRTHRWVTPVAYGLATAVSFSRITGSAHYPSDVFFGAVIGYTIGRFAVLHE